jgi:plasmid replication initiation protein
MIDKKNLVEKSNLLNSFSCNDMSLIELRFFCLYLSRLNARNPSQRTVVIPIEEFEYFFDIKVNTTLFTQKIKRIAGRTVEIRLNNKNKILTLYSQFEWAEKDPRSISITCNYDIMPYIFELKKNYTTYMIGNIAKLNSVSKIRLYEICKQYEKIGTIKLNIDELKQILGSLLKEFKEFKRITLEPAIKDINQYTDIEVSYEKVLSCRKVVALNFTIKPKKQVQIEPTEPIEVVESVEKAVEKSIPQPEPQQYPDLVTKVYNKCYKVYTMEQVQSLLDMAEMISDNPAAYVINMYYTIRAYNTKINNMYNYTLSVIQANLSKKSKESPKKKKRETSYDINEFMDFVHSTKRIMTPDDYQEEVKPTPKVEETQTCYQETSSEQTYDDFEEILSSDEMPFE